MPVRGQQVQEGDTGNVGVLLVLSVQIRVCGRNLCAAT